MYYSSGSNKTAYGILHVSFKHILIWNNKQNLYEYISPVATISRMLLKAMLTRLLQSI